MALQRRSVPAPDGSGLVGRLAVLLARSGPLGLPEALSVLVQDGGLRSAVLRSAGVGGADGELVAVGGDVVRAVSSAAALPVCELPVPGRPVAGTLTVVGARPAQLPALRAAAAVFGLVLAASAPAHTDDLSLRALLQDAEADRDELADRLHDGAVQDLVVARLVADAAVGGGSPALVREAVQTALVAMRRALWHLRPRGDDGLAAALHILSGRLEEAGGRALDLQLAPGAVLSGAGATTAYRLVQSVALSAPSRAVRVSTRRGAAPGGRQVTVTEITGGGPLEEAQRWCRRARALGGGLTVEPDRLHLALPAPDAPATPLDPGSRSSTAKASP